VQRAEDGDAAVADIVLGVDDAATSWMSARSHVREGSRWREPSSNDPTPCCDVTR
jgi:hypothetical protein